VYDSIECLVRDADSPAGAWLADCDDRTLHAADSMWVVRGELPSPMGGGLAACLRREAAEETAARTRGAVLRLGDLIAERAGGTR
jgi:nitrous oxide reductase accessory protein NosL